MQVARFGAVFDLNGVIINDGRLHDSAWLDIANRGRAVKRTVADVHRLSGISNLAMAKALCPGAKSEEIVAEKARIYESSLYRQLQIDPRPLKVPGACEFVDRLFQESVSLALNTSSPLNEVEQILGAFGIMGHFSQLLTAESVQNHKPDPEGYLTAAHNFGFPPRECAGFEDSIPGLNSLKSANYGVIVAVGTLLSEAKVRAACPWISRYIPDFSRFTLNELSGLFSQV